jgi:hypothetical protein
VVSTSRRPGGKALGFQIGYDPAVQRAAGELRKALIAAAQAAGHELQTYALVWASRHGDDCHSACLVEGDTSVEVIELMADVLVDDSNDVTLPPLGRVN